MKAARELRDAFGRYATGVAVVTTARGPDSWIGMTVNSFTSVSLDPPLVLFAVGKTANCRRAFAECERFAVSILRHDQQDVSTNFAHPSTSRWEEMSLQKTSAGDCLIPGALATFQCRRQADHEAGDHVLIIGCIECFSAGTSVRPLVFFRGGYGSFSPDQGALTIPPRPDSGSSDFTLGWG